MSVDIRWDPESSRKLAARPLSVVDYELSVIPAQEIIEPGAEGEPVEIGDSIFLRNSEGTVGYGWQIQATAPVTYSVHQGEGLVEVDASGLVRATGTGHVVVFARNEYGLTKRLNLYVSISEGESVDVWDSYAPGTLGKYLVDHTDPLWDNVVTHPAAMYSYKGSHTEYAFTRDPNCWATAGGIDLTPIVARTNGSSPTSYNWFGGVLVSPRHTIHANHILPPDGMKLYFVDADNNLVERTIVSGARIGNTDIYLATLDEDVPESISFCEVLPANWHRDYLPTLSDGIYSSTAGRGYVPAWHSNRSKRLQSNELRGINDQYCYFVPAAPAVPIAAHRAPWYLHPSTGDSGSGHGIIIDGALKLCGTWYGSSSGPNIASYASAINAVMQPSGYELTVCDLSDFTYFGN